MPLSGHTVQVSRKKTYELKNGNQNSREEAIGEKRDGPGLAAKESTSVWHTDEMNTEGNAKPSKFQLQIQRICSKTFKYLY